MSSVLLCANASAQIIGGVDSHATNATDGFPDVVRTTTGAMYRGTILEIVPGDHITIRTATGEDRRVAASEITYAGAASADPSPRAQAVAPLAPTTPQPAADLAAAPQPGEVVVRFEGAPGITIHRQVTVEGVMDASNRPKTVHTYTPLCTAPCTLSLAPGFQPLALSTGAQAPTLVPGGLVVAPGTYLASYRSRRGVRIAGGVILLAGAVLGATIVGLGVRNANECESLMSSVGLNDSCRMGPAIAAGSITIGLGLIAGIAMITRHDIPRLTPVGVRF